METICMLLQKKKQFILFPPTAAFSSCLWTWVYFPPAKSVVLERKCMHTFSNKNNPNMVLNFFHIYWILIQQTSILLDASFSTHQNLYLFVWKIMWIDHFHYKINGINAKKAQNTSKQIEREFDFIWHVA